MSLVDKLDRINWDYSSRIYERYNFFRSDSPEGDLRKRYQELKEQNDRLKSQWESMNSKLPDDLKEELPF